MSVLDLTRPFHMLDGHIAIELPGARALFTTRGGGFSKPPYDSLNLGLLTDDDPEDVRRNREALAATLGHRLAYAKQVHGNVVRVVDRPNDQSLPAADGDGIATRAAGVAAMVLAADCLPIAIAGGGAAAVVHAGWPGLAQDVIAAGVAAVRALSLDPEAEVAAAIGPGAGPCCYEVGDDLHERFAARGEDLRRGQNLDLKAIARRQLQAAGIATVHDVGICTICSDPSLLYSHRRDRGVTGRQAGLVWLS